MSDTFSLTAWLAAVPTVWTDGCDPRAIERAHAAYQSPGRHYHTWDHVVACVERLKTFHCDNPRLIFLALVFHDAIYVAGRHDNEQKSTDLARDTLSTMCAVAAEDIGSIERMILATRDHHAQASTLRDDEKTMLDIDLSILGATRHDYARYAAAVHDEYVPAAATDMQFRIGRLEFLRRTLAMPHLFLTAEGRRRWEEPARANIAWEIAELVGQQGLIERGISAVRKRS